MHSIPVGFAPESNYTDGQMEKVRQLIEGLRSDRVRLIGVDGAPGAGKTTVARYLAKALGAVCVHVDSFLTEGQGTYVLSIDYVALRQAISQERRTAVVEGLCLLAVLDRLSLKPDFLVYVDPESRFANVRKSAVLLSEVRDYTQTYAPRAKAQAVLSLEDLTMSPSHDVDIAFIKSKTIVSVTLAVGGLLQTIAGALLLNAGLNEPGAASLRIMGSEVSASGLGAIVLCTSVMWAYFAYLARPKFSSRSETKSTTAADGASEFYEFRSSTQAGAARGPRTRGDQ
jgi:hypothetical protein